MFKSFYQKTISSFSQDKTLKPEDISKSVYLELLNEGVLEVISKDVLKKINQKLLSIKKKHTLEDVFEVVRSSLIDILCDIFGNRKIKIDIQNGVKTNILITGNYGVGKTSFCAKLARHYASIGYKVCVATVDKKRHGSQDQLKLLTKNIGVRFIEIDEFNTKSNLQILYEIGIFSQGCDILILDSSGVCDVNGISELFEISSSIDFHETLFLADAIHGSSSTDLIDKIIKSGLRLTGLCFSKFDGSINFGSVINAKVLSLKPIYFYTDGESLDSIFEFNPTEFIKKIISSIEFSAKKDEKENKKEEMIPISSFLDLKNYIQLKTDKYSKIHSVIDGISSMLTSSESLNPIKISYEKKKKIAQVLGIQISLIDKLIILFKSAYKKSIENGFTEKRLVYEDLIDD